MDKLLFKNLVKGISRIDRRVCISLFRKMLKIRMTEDRIAELYPEQEMRCPTHLYTGQEAVSSGVCENLKREDYLFSSYRSHGAYLAKGGSIRKLMAELYGKKTGCSKGRGGSMHIVSKEVNFMGTSAMVGGVIPIAAGTALASSMRGEKSVSVVFFGDGACEEGVFHETLNFSALKRLPVIFICENNFYATHSHQAQRQALDNIYERSKIYGIPGVRIDGNNILEVFEVSKRFIGDARRGKGPALIECRTYRWLEHVGPCFDYELGYRSKAELDMWMDRCPVAVYEYALLQERIITRQSLDAIKKEIMQEIDRAVTFAKASPFPSDAEIYEDVYDEGE